MRLTPSVAVALGTALVLLAAGCSAGSDDVGERGNAAGGGTAANASGSSTVQANSAPGTAEHPVRETLTIPAPSLAKNFVDEPTEQNIQVFVPADYNTSSKRYPVVYYLPGFGDPYEGVFNVEQADQMILVAVNGINQLGGSFYYNSPVTGNWEDFVTQDVVSYIDSQYRTIAKPEGRAITGHSMGGFGVLNAAMHTDVYSYAYSLSPGVFAEDGLSEFALQFGVLSEFVETNTSLDDAAIRAAFLKKSATMSWPTDLSFSYAAAFAPDAAGRAPYIELPQRNAAGEYEHDAVWNKYNAGYGNIPAKLDKYGNNLKKLKGLVIEYGTRDEFTFIPKGCDYLSAQLTARGIDHELLTYDGDHQSELYFRIDDTMLPYLKAKFGA